MNTSKTARAIAFVASLLMTATSAYFMATYAYPEPPEAQLASAGK